LRIRLFTIYIVCSACLLLSSSVNASESVAAIKLIYQELEQGIEPYVLTYTVNSDYVKIEDEADTSGYIIYDIKANSIYSVNHYDQAILVIPEYPVTDFKPEFNVDIEYEIFKDAPSISGKEVFSYRVKAVTDETSETCMKIQLVPGLLPDVANSLQGFQRLMSGQQAFTLEQTPEEYRTPCYLVDQIYNKGEYYSKGLPIHEWHSNERMRQLLNYENVEVDASIFDIPDEYRQYSLK
jgi:hypothetical protein